VIARNCRIARDREQTNRPVVLSAGFCLRFLISSVFQAFAYL
jgi:hypothetical protein